MLSVCKVCQTEFEHSPSRRGVYCSRECYRVSPPPTTHGQSGAPEYHVWKDIRKRCNNPTNSKYRHYGARGIKVCERWDNYENFIADIGTRPDKTYSIERINNDGNYEPSNCKWATKTEQSRNRRGVYTPQEDQKIREAIALGYSFPQMAEYVGKGRGSVQARTYYLGLKSGQPPPGGRKYA